MQLLSFVYIWEIILIILWQTAGIVYFSNMGNFYGSNGYYGNGLDVVGHGIWCAVFYMITGFLGYSTSYRKTKSLY